jgi:hypothetical protein
MPQTLRGMVGTFGRAICDRPKEPVPLQAILIAVAVLGSGLYGASLSLVLPSWNAARAAMWLAGSAGLAWAMFIPSLWIVTGLPFRRCWEASLVTMGCGEVVLASGALTNALLWLHHATVHAAAVNAWIVAISNVVMAISLVVQLRPHGIQMRTTLTAWIVVLNGSGAVIFAVLFRLLYDR